MLGLLIISIAFVSYLVWGLKIGTETYIPFANKYVTIPIWLYIPFAILVILATTNAINLTDGIDGLSSSVSTIIITCLTIIATMFGTKEIIVFGAIVIGATLGLIKKELSSEEIAKLASTIEPTDSIYIEKNSIFNPLNGEVIRYLGNVKDLRVVILEPNSTLNTMRIRKTPNYKKIKTQNKEIIKISFSLLEEGIKSNDMHKIGKASTFSSLANESIHKKEGLEKIIEISKNYGAYGVNVAHSGTVVGILIDKSMNDTRLIELLKNERLDSVYKKMYTSNIIDGGIRGEQTWNTSKIL